MTDTTKTLFCSDCRTDVKLRSGENGIHAVCECIEVPLMVRRGLIHSKWSHYTPLQEE